MVRDVSTSLEMTKGSNIARERQLKKWSRSKKVALTATLNPRWKDLAPEVL
jgi:predicted GIY-YIG superfamily endonuclease